MRPGTPGFIGGRLRESRESRGMTAIALADLIGVTRAAVSQYENGRQSPSPETLQRIAHVLNIPAGRFLLPTRERQRGPVFYRSMSSATKRARIRAERRYEWLREIAEYIQGHAKLPAVKMPVFDVPDRPEKLSNEQIEEFATEARRFWGLQDGPITNIVWLLENNGAVVARCDLDADTLDAFSEWPLADPRPYIVLAADKCSAVRSRFDAAHELGHMLLHRAMQPTAIRAPGTFKLVEQQAHRFASAFLLPANSFCQEFRMASLESLRTLKGRWKVAISAMIVRAAQLHLISEAEESRLWMNLSRRKWRTREPLDNVLEIEQPRLLKRCLELLLSRGIVSHQDPTFKLGISASDIEQLVGLEAGTIGGLERHIVLESDDQDSGDGEARSILRFPFAS